jgi:hypothetical protein
MVGFFDGRRSTPLGLAFDFLFCVFWLNPSRVWKNVGFYGLLFCWDLQSHLMHI